MPLNPFSVTVEPMAAMVNFEIADDPVYTGLEIQRFDDDVHGQGVVALLMRREDRRADVHHAPGLRLDRASYQIGAGVGEWRATEFETARLEVTPHGVVARLKMHDSAGRAVEVLIDDRDERPRRAAALLAPVSAAIEKPESMMLVWMQRFDLMRRRGSFEVRIGGRSAAIGQLPMGFLHGRRLVKYASDLAIVRLNPAVDGPLAATPGDSELRTLAVATSGHDVRLDLDPPLPELAGLDDGAAVSGEWRLAIGTNPSVVSGSWSARRAGNEVAIELDSTGKWRPGPLPLLMRIVTRIVPTFRNWPTTYRWHANIRLGPTPTIRSRWERKGTAAAESYSRLMRTDRPTSGSRSGH